MKHISLRELCGLVEKTAGKKLPTARALRESGIPVVVRAEIGVSGELTVYQNGFYTYRVAGCTTVYAVDRCAGYSYDSGEALDAAFFEDEEWTLRLMLTGEDRLMHNGNRREEKPRAFSLDEKGANWDRSDGIDFTACVADRDAAARLLSHLTVKQRQVAERYFIAGQTQEAIQQELGISRGAFLDRLNGAIKKLQRVVNDPVKTPSSAWDLWRDPNTSAKD